MMMFVTTSVTIGAPFLLVFANALMNTPCSAASYGDSLDSTVYPSMAPTNDSTTPPLMSMAPHGPTAYSMTPAKAGFSSWASWESGITPMLSMLTIR